MKLKVLRRSLWAILGLILALVIFGLLQLIEPIDIAPVGQLAQQVQFSGRALLVASDADMAATAYADSKLYRVAGVEDTLSVIPLPVQSNSANVSSIQVSNSVMS